MAQYYASPAFQAKVYHAMDSLSDNAYIAIHTGNRLTGELMLNLLTPQGGGLGCIAVAELFGKEKPSAQSGWQGVFYFSEINTSPNTLVIHANSDINSACQFANALYEALLADPDRFAGCMVRVGCGGAVLFVSPSIAPPAPVVFNTSPAGAAAPVVSKPLESLELRDSLKRRGVPAELANLVMYAPSLLVQKLKELHSDARWVRGFHMTMGEEQFTLSSPVADITVNINKGLTVNYLDGNPDMDVLKQMLSVIAEPFE